jgi:hypothetical protein
VSLLSVSYQLSGFKFGMALGVRMNYTTQGSGREILPPKNAGIKNFVSLSAGFVAFF